MRRTLLLICVLLTVCTLPACAAPSEGETTAAPETEEQKTLYALGLAMAQSLGTFDLSAEELATIQNGLKDGVLGNDPQVDLEEYGPKIQAMAQERASRVADAEKTQGAEWLAEMASEEGAQTTDSGIVYFVMNEGTGENPAATDTVEVHYHGTLRDGTVFDSSVERGETVKFGLNQVIGCWTEAVQLMKEGGKMRIICPNELAYGERAAGKIPAGAALSFEVELVDIVDPAAPPSAPAPPTDG